MVRTSVDDIRDFTVRTDCTFERYIPSVLKLKEIPKKPLSKKEQKLIFELDFPSLAKAYAKAFSDLLSGGETLDDLVQEAYFRLPVFFARYDKSRRLTAKQRKDFDLVRLDFFSFFSFTAKLYHDKTWDHIKNHENTKYRKGVNQVLRMSPNQFEALHCVTNDKLIQDRFLEIRTKLWINLPAGPDTFLKKEKGCNNIQSIVNMRDSGATIATIRYLFLQFKWTKEQQVEALGIIERYYDQLWEETKLISGQPFSNWASDWLEAISASTESAFINANNKSVMGKVA